MFGTIVLGATLILCTFAGGKGQAAPEPVLIVISLDGFRDTFFDRHVTPTMQMMRVGGTHAEFLRPVFPTKTFVNHFSIGTGLFAGTHGVLGNEVYDAVKGTLTYGYDLFHQNSTVLPIWTQNELSGKHSGCMMWPGSDFPYANTSCTFTQTLEKGMTWARRIDMVLSWIEDKNTPANLVMFYLDQPDDDAHAFGPDSDKETSTIRELDNALLLLLRTLYRKKLEDRVNLIVLSDHGMSTIPVPHFIDLTAFLTPGTYSFAGSSPILQVIPMAGFENEVFANLSQAASAVDSHFSVYDKDTVLDRWRVWNYDRFGPFLAVAEPTFGFQDMLSSADWFMSNRGANFSASAVYGNHGYDNEAKDMRAIFFAYGPIFSQGKVLEPFDNVDLCNLFCQILRIECAPNEGTDRSHLWDILLKKNEMLEKSAETIIQDEISKMLRADWKSRGDLVKRFTKSYRTLQPSNKRRALRQFALNSFRNFGV